MVIIIPIQSQWEEFGSQPAGRRFFGEHCRIWWSFSQLDRVKAVLDIPVCDASTGKASAKKWVKNIWQLEWREGWRGLTETEQTQIPNKDIMNLSPRNSHEAQTETWYLEVKWQVVALLFNIWNADNEKIQDLSLKYCGRMRGQCGEISREACPEAYMCNLSNHNISNHSQIGWRIASPAVWPVFLGVGLTQIIQSCRTEPGALTSVDFTAAFVESHHSEMTATNVN